MATRDVVQELIHRLSSSDEVALSAALTDAYLLLDKTCKYHSAEALVHDVDLQRGFQHLPPGWTDTYVQESQDAFRPLLPPEYLDVLLSSEEVDVIARRLLDLIDRKPGASPLIVMEAARALGFTNRLYAAPALTALVRTYAATDANISTNAVNSLANILLSIDQRLHRSNEDERIISEALASLRYAARAGLVDALWNVPETARHQLKWLSRRFRRRR